MTEAEIRKAFLPLLPVVEAEMTVDVITAAFDEAADFYSLYYPKTDVIVIKPSSWIYTFLDPAPRAILRVYYYSIGIPSTTRQNLFSEWTYIRPDLYIIPGMYYVRITYNLEMEDVDFKTYPYFRDLLKAEIKMAIANKRRVGNVGQMALDLKGDKFYEEAQKEKEKTREMIYKTIIPVHY